MSDFRFSPRPNRAAEIGWMPWGQAAFARAVAEDKPILLSISAVWCHWCHVMDETSYSDPAVIETIARHFVPVRVDNDRRPDINARYNMGGWPTTAFLAPDGSTLTGATYLAPEQMRQVLGEIARFYAERKNEIATRVSAPRPFHTVTTDAPAQLDDAPSAALLTHLENSFDREYGGFGDAPKFPQPDVLEFLVTQWRAHEDAQIYAMVAQTLLAMARGGMYDHVEGGFFRYSTTRDWSVPHFEKMAEDHAGLLRVLAGLLTFARNDDLRATLVSAIGFVRTVLRDPKTGFFGGSQDADEAYFSLPLAQRRERGAPFVDRTSYTNWTCALAGAQCVVARALDDDVMLNEAMYALDSVHERLRDSDGLVYHVLSPDAAPTVRGLFTDQVAYARALLDAHEISGENRFIVRAQALCDATILAFAADGGGFYDRLRTDDTLGRLSLPDRPIVDNGAFADVLLRLGALTNDPTYRKRAAITLGTYVNLAVSSGPFAATYARALMRYLAPEVTVRIVGSPLATGAFRETAGRLPSPFTTVRTLSPQDAGDVGLPSSPAPAAYLCAGATCSAPALEAQDLGAIYAG